MQYNEDMKKEIQAFKQIAKTQDGQVMLDAVRRFCQYDMPLGKSHDELLFNEGKRLVYLFIKGRIELKDE